MTTLKMSANRQKWTKEFNLRLMLNSYLGLPSKLCVDLRLYGGLPAL